MNNLIIIDDTTCKEELKSFITANADQIRLCLTEEDYNIDLDILIQKIHSVFDDQKLVFIKTADSFIKVAIAEIFCIKEEDTGLFLHLIDDTSHLLPEKIEHYKHSFSNYNIIQIADKILLNTSFIESYVIDQGVLFCVEGVKFDVENQYKSLLLNQLNSLE